MALKSNTAESNTATMKSKLNKSKSGTIQSNDRSTLKSNENSTVESNISTIVKSDEISTTKSNKNTITMSNDSRNTKANENATITTTQVDIKDKLIKSVKEQCRLVDVPVQCQTPNMSNSSFLRTDSGKTITVPAIEKKKITTIQKINPKKTQTLFVKELKPIITVTRDKNKEIKQIKTPINKHLTTTTTVQRSTTTTTETTIFIGKAAESAGFKTVK